eukprot:Hpha_TRINITY_DN29891_c0_g1::TRINITY_DN29891_c0_g1_i1::g.2857::m.2857
MTLDSTPVDIVWSTDCFDRGPAPRSPSCGDVDSGSSGVGEVDTPSADTHDLRLDAGSVRLDVGSVDDDDDDGISGCVHMGKRSFPAERSVLGIISADADTEAVIRVEPVFAAGAAPPPPVRSAGWESETLSVALDNSPRRSLGGSPPRGRIQSPGVYHPGDDELAGEVEALQRQRAHWQQECAPKLEAMRQCEELKAVRKRVGDLQAELASVLINRRAAGLENTSTQTRLRRELRETTADLAATQTEAAGLRDAALGWADADDTHIAAICAENASLRAQIQGSGALAKDAVRARAAAVLLRDSAQKLRGRCWLRWACYQAAGLGRARRPRGGDPSAPLAVLSTRRSDPALRSAAPSSDPAHGRGMEFDSGHSSGTARAGYSSGPPQAGPAHHARGEPPSGHRGGEFGGGYGRETGTAPGYPGSGPGGAGPLLGELDRQTTEPVRGPGTYGAGSGGASPQSTAGGLAPRPGAASGYGTPGYRGAEPSTHGSGAPQAGSSASPGPGPAGYRGREPGPVAAEPPQAAGALHRSGGAGPGGPGHRG